VPDSRDTQAQSSIEPGENIVGDGPEVQEELDELMSVLLNESDRGAVLVGLAILDAQIEELLKTKFEAAQAAYLDQQDFHSYEGDFVALTTRHQRVARRLLAYPGPLSTAAARQDVAFAMGWINEDVYDDLNRLRNLRNKAAHSTDPLHLFDDKETQRLIHAMKFANPMFVNVRAVYKHGFLLMIIELQNYLLHLTLDGRQSVQRKLKELLGRYDDFIRGGT
jgi:hypothetical protein